MLLSYPGSQSRLQVLQGIIKRRIGFLPFLDHPTYIQGADK
jgi:hypothetical protein